MSVSASFRDYVLEQLSALGRVSSRRMFGGVGLYCDGQFFGLIDDDVLYLKVDDRNRGEYLARGMEPFRPYRDRPERSMSYYQAPVDVMEDAALLANWARDSLRAARESPSRTATRVRRAKPRRNA
jgi:DNA transformation protein and related proteins